MSMVLSPVEARVVGSLIEKEFTTPEYYPLSLHALAAACSQKSNRDPVIHFGESEIMQALDSLRDKHLAWQTTAPGARVPKYRHDAAAVFALTPPELAILGELLLRGPQTVGELRTHAARFCEFADLAQVEATLRKLAEREAGPLVVKLAREAGRRENRFAQLLTGEAFTVSAPPEAAPPAATAHADRIARLEQEVAALRAEMAELKQQIDERQPGPEDQNIPK